MTLWKLLTQVHRTVTPTEMLTVSGQHKTRPHRHIDNRAVRPMERRSRLAGHFDRECGWAARYLYSAIVRLSPDSACTKNTMANIIASQKIDRFCV